MKFGSNTDKDTTLFELGIDLSFFEKELFDCKDPNLKSYLVYVKGPKGKVYNLMLMSSNKKLSREAVKTKLLGELRKAGNQEVEKDEIILKEKNEIFPNTIDAEKKPFNIKKV